jgi:tetratricopeptide (TPR) repeat protein
LKLSRVLSGDLDWIVMKAIAKERDRRYEAASGFARDIERYLNHEPVLAGPPSPGYRLKKFVRRNQGKVSAGIVLMLALLGGIAGTSFGLIRAETRRAEAEQARAAEAEQHANADANATKAQAAADSERQAKEREAGERKRAEIARDRTRQALDAMTSAVVGESLTAQKQLSDEQRKFLTDALTYYREFAGEHADDEQSRLRMVQAAERVGRIEGRLGRNKEAVEAFSQASAAASKLVADFPTVPNYRQELARSHNNLALMLVSQGHQAEAEEHYRQAIELKKNLVADSRITRAIAKSSHEVITVSGSCLPVSDCRQRRNSSIATLCRSKKS